MTHMCALVQCHILFKIISLLFMSINLFCDLGKNPELHQMFTVISNPGTVERGHQYGGQCFSQEVNMTSSHQYLAFIDTGRTQTDNNRDQNQTWRGQQVLTVTPEDSLEPVPHKPWSLSASCIWVPSKRNRTNILLFLCRRVSVNQFPVPCPRVGLGPERRWPWKGWRGSLGYWRTDLSFPTSHSTCACNPQRQELDSGVRSVAINDADSTYLASLHMIHTDKHTQWSPPNWT